MKKSISRIIGVIMLIVAIVFIVFALNHPEKSALPAICSSPSYNAPFCLMLFFLDTITHNCTSDNKLT